MGYETDNAESRIGRTQETLTTGDGAVSEAYAEMAAQSRQQRTERQAGIARGNSSDYLVLTDPYGDLHVGPPPRTDRIPPIPAPPLQWDHEAARRQGEEGDRRAQQRLHDASRRRHGHAPH